MDGLQDVFLLMAGETIPLTCCLSTRFFTPSMTNWEPVFITLENSLQRREEGKGTEEGDIRKEGGGGGGGSKTE